MSRLAALGELSASVAYAQSVSGRSLASIALELRHLRKKAELFGVSDYFLYRLYEPLPSGGRKEDFAGWRMEGWLDGKLNASMWRGIVEDKCVFHSICTMNGLPVPRVHAIYHRAGRGLGEVPKFTDPAALAKFIRNAMPHPFFSKPVFGVSGGGAAAVLRFDSSRDALVLADGRNVGVDAFVEGLSRPSRGATPSLGWLFQEQMVQHPQIADVCGPTVATLRFIVLFGDECPRIHRVVWRIPTGKNMTDNFGRHGSTNNLAAALDEETGEVMRAIGGVGQHLTVHERHPDTNARLTGWRLPLYDEARALVLKASTSFPMLRFQHWDIAITHSGPVLVECNSPGGIELPQIAAGRGIYDESLRAFVARHGGAGPR